MADASRVSELSRSTLHEDDSPSMDFLRALVHISAPTHTMATRAPAPSWEGDRAGRFVVRSRLGEGGFGVVYEAHDTTRDAVVALKLLREQNAHTLYRFKQEFRSIAETSHPNLVRMHELFAEEERWFFTMERVHGEHVHRYLRGKDERAVRAVFTQIVDALIFLHGHGKIHGDIKPTNVVVTPEGRVVLLDLGLVMEIGTEIGIGAGTPAYMAPEQAAGRAVGPAADWYSVGVMLFEVLTGMLPTQAEAGVLPRWPLEPDRAVSADLEALTLALLDPSPRRRPSGEALRRVFAGGDAAASTWNAPPERELVFVGRRPELAQLEAAFEAARRGRVVLARVHGPAGMGKSALLEHFLGALRLEPHSLVLAGRCFEQEAVPFKTVDGLIDALARHLDERARAVGSLLDASELAALVRMFPVLPLHVERAAPADESPTEARRRAIAALQRVLALVTGPRTLVLAVDDLHFGDADGMSLLLELVRSWVDEPVLILVTHRSESGTRGKALIEALDQLPHDPSFKHVSIVDIPLEALDARAAHALAVTLFGAADPRIDALVSETHGHPFFLSELARSSASDAARPHGLDALLRERIAALREEARTLLQVVAAAGQPLDRGCAVRVLASLSMARDDFEALAALRSARLVRTQRDEIEVYHDRIRELALEMLTSSQRAALHGALAAVLESLPRSEPERLHRHYELAGDIPRAVHHAEHAARLAHHALAFDRAATLYRFALEHAAPTAGQAHRRALQARLGDALACLGRPSDAAAAYLDAARGGDDIESLEWKRLAVEQLLFGGYTARGLDVLRTLMHALDLDLPFDSRAGLAISALRWRGRRAIAWRTRPRTRSGPFDRRALLQIDTAWTAAIALTLVDPLLALTFQSMHTVLAHRMGEPYRLARMLAFEGALRTLMGGAVPASLLEMAHAIAAEADDPRTRGHVALLQAVAHTSRGEWDEAERLAQESIEHLRRNGTMVWEEDIATQFLASSRRVRGLVAMLRADLPEAIREARARGNLQREAYLRLMCAPVVHLAADRPDLAQADVEAAASLFPSNTASMQRMRRVIALLRVAIYRQDAEEAQAILRRELPGLVRPGLLRLTHVRSELVFLIALAARLQLARSSHEEAPRAVVRVCAALLERQSVPWWPALARTLRASLAHDEGECDTAVRLMLEAEAVLWARDMPLFALAARHRRATWTGDEALRLDAEDAMRERGVVDPVRMTALYLGP